MDTLAHHWRLLIGGELREPVLRQRYPVLNPSTGSTLAEAPDGDEHDVDVAYRAAARAAGQWGRFAPRARAALVRDLAGILRANASDLAALAASDHGCPFRTMLLDVEDAAVSLEMFADYAPRLAGTVIPAGDDNVHYTVREPFGVTGVIGPPSRIAAPLVAGNAVILIAARQAPLTALRIGELFADALPPGVLNVVTASPDSVAAHRLIRRIAFTGNERAGRSVQLLAARAAVKTVTLAVSGKNVMVVLDDADLAAAASGAAREMCPGTATLLVHESVADELVRLVVQRIRSLTVGAAVESAVDIGPLGVETQANQIVAYIAAAQRDGATVACGGGRLPGPGFFVEPTVLTGVGPGMTVFSAEVPGPVLSVVTFTDDEEAAQLANAVDHGLSTGVWTRSLDRAYHLTAAFEAGSVCVNGSAQRVPGVAECAEELRSFTRTKAVTVSVLGDPGDRLSRGERLDDVTGT